MGNDWTSLAESWTRFNKLLAFRAFKNNETFANVKKSAKTPQLGQIFKYWKSF